MPKRLFDDLFSPLKNYAVPPIPDDNWQKIVSIIKEPTTKPLFDFVSFRYSPADFLSFNSFLFRPAMAIALGILLVGITYFPSQFRMKPNMVNTFLQEQAAYLYSGETYFMQEGGVNSISLEESLAYLSS